MKVAGEYLHESASSGNGAEFPGCPEDQHHDQESCSRMDSEGSPMGAMKMMDSVPRSGPL
jgi:hypothetical protein